MSSANPTRRGLVGLICALLMTIAVAPVRGDDAKGSYRLAIKGYDPVAYFTEGRPVKGVPDFELVWNDARWHFASAANRDLFRADAERYAPQYVGYCALGVALGKKFDIDPRMWTIVDSKLYLNHNREIRDDWRKNRIANIRQANEQWRAMRP